MINFETSLQIKLNYIDVCKQTIISLDELNNRRVKKHHRICKSFKSFGAAANTLGTGMWITAASTLIPTVGLSIIYGIAGTGIGVIGTTTCLLTESIDQKVTKNIKIEIKNILIPRLEIAKELQKHFNFIELYLLEDFSINVPKLIKDSFHTFSKYLKFFDELSKALKNMSKIFSQFKICGFIFGTLSLAMTIIDDYTLIKSWSKDYELSIEIDEIIKKIEVSIQFIKAMNKSIESEEPTNDVNDALCSLVQANKNKILEILTKENCILFDSMDNNQFQNASFISSENFYKSFDNFDDFLYIKLLMYLSFEDKLRLECVNKQWKRCLFSRKRLFITDNKICLSNMSEMNHINCKKDYDEIPIHKMIKFYDHNKITISNVINNVIHKYLDIEHITFDDNINDDIFLTVVNCCKNLQSLEFNINSYEKKTIKYLGETCGNNLTCINFGNNYSVNKSKAHKLIKFCPNLLRIKIKDINDIVCDEEILVSQLCESLTHLDSDYVDKKCSTEINNIIRLFNDYPIYTICNLFEKHEIEVIKFIEKDLKKFELKCSIGKVRDIDDTMYMTIIDNCKQLSIIKFNSNYYDSKTITYLRNKYGNNLDLVKFSYQDGSGDCNPENLFNFEEIINIISSSIVITPKLYDVSALNGCINTNALKLFVKRYANTLNLFEFTNNCSDLEINKMQINLICNLIKLNKLKLLFQNIEIDLILDIIVKIGAKCYEIKVLEIKHIICRQNSDKFINYPKSINAGKFLSSINSFKQLTHLTIFMPFFNCEESNKNFRFELLKDCKQLTKINIKATIDDTFFYNVHLYLPNLVALKLETNISLSNKAMKSLEKLKHLRSIYIEINSGYTLITEEGINEFVENCVRIAFVTINPFIKNDISKLFEIAYNNRRIIFTYFSDKSFFCPNILDNLIINKISCSN